LQLFDRDFFKSNDIIGEAMLDIGAAVKEVDLCNRPISITKKYYTEFLKEKCGNILEFKDEN